MRISKLILSVVAISAVVGVGAASAADMAPRYTKAPPITPPVFSWTGCYIGGNAGGLAADKKWYDPTRGDFYEVNHDPSGFVGGGQVGCNYQTGPFVFGIQADYDWTNASASSTPLPGSTFRTGQILGTSLRGLGSVTGRAGYAWDRVLGYVKGGGAWVSDRYSSTFATGVLASTASGDRAGWTVGVGVEYMFAPNWSVFAEYDYYDFGTRRLSFTTPAAALDFNEDIKQTINLGKVGLNYHFNWVSPVVAKY
jgi:outer membrane immunogenic protein